MLAQQLLRGCIRKRAALLPRVGAFIALAAPRITHRTNQIPGRSDEIPISISRSLGADMSVIHIICLI